MKLSVINYAKRFKISIIQVFLVNEKMGNIGENWGFSENFPG